ncbi:uncharacterized protein DSM5745_08834 [Aspergillus mulundensis]|uniref:Transcription factor domain-containing protein n=1 Tax=Aspergillus mulundensis TaxID=1810919 RepID=A0A3D8R5I8_9EURO|nr:hypothetical protein DSM5745_08834 [Aspergillus mulundensis]RDW69074.1 hypothetical protein DSM5745_08834 [Aspergillus mulundensis]
MLLEAHHWQRAIRQYSTDLNCPVGPEDMDALFSACLLMTVNSFALDSYNPAQSFVFSPTPARSLNWLMWWEMFMDSRNDLFDDNRFGREGLRPDLADLCDITESTTTENNPYLWPLRMLTPLLALEPSLTTFSRTTTFMGRLMPDYYERLIAKHPPALVILA